MNLGLPKSAIHKSAIAIIFISGMVFFVGNVFAADNLQEQLRKTQQQINATKTILELKKNQASLLDNQIGVLEQRTGKLEEDIKGNSQKIEEITLATEVINSKINSNENAVALKKDILSGLVRSYYDLQQMGESMGAATEGSDGIFFGTRDRFSTLQEKIATELDEITQLQIVLAADKRKIEEGREELAGVHEELENQRTYLEGAQSQKQALLTQTKTEQKVFQKKLSKLEEERRDIENEIEDIESAKTGQLDLKSMPAPKKGLLGYPVAAPLRISQGYGKASWTRWYTFHNGVDFAGKIGDSVFSAAPGKVVALGDSGRYAYGKWIAVDHGNGLTTLYGHLSKHITQNGSSVKEGQVIGLLGNTGYSTGPHVHFTVFSSKSFDVVQSAKVAGVKIPAGAHVDPNKYLK